MEMEMVKATLESRVLDYFPISLGVTEPHSEI
jgi:hypothetical protein